MILRFLFLVFVIYIAYRLLFDFIIPVYRTTRRIKKGFREMQERMGQQQSAPYGEPAQPGPGKPVSGDYIDFEEIKE